VAIAQSEAPLAFEVASVKQHLIPNGNIRRPSSSNLRCPPFNCGISGNRFTEEVASLSDLMMDAYNVKRYQISGLPNWGDSGRDVYDIAAKVEGDKTPTQEQVRRMLQTLLADRFQLRVHREQKELPIFALVVAKNGPKLTRLPQEGDKPPAPCPNPSPRPEMRDGPGGDKGGDGGRGGGGRKGGGGGRQPSGDQFAFLRSWERTEEMLTAFSGRPVVDKTGFSGFYCTLDGQDPVMAIISQISPQDDGTSILPLVQEKWGLKLEPQKAMVEILVIDRVERPSAN
jgi:uncharacterized protein (TIGR03435 family)